MEKASGWNMHNVIEIAPMTDADTRVRDALEAIDGYSHVWLQQPAQNLCILRSISQAPKTALSHLRELADTLDFALMPMEYVDPRSYENEPRETKETIDRFRNTLAPWFHIYVLAPLEQYSLSRHIQTEQDLPMYVSARHTQTFEALNLCVPIFRGLKQDIANLRKKFEMDLSARQERRHLRLLDPLMVAIPKTENVRGHGLAVIGPAWGPDLEDILVESLRLTVRTTQRHILETSVRMLLQGGEKTPAGHAEPGGQYRIRINDMRLPDITQLKKEFDVVSPLYNGRTWKAAADQAIAPGERLMTLKHFGESRDSDEAIEQTDPLFRHATHRELLEFTRTYPDMQRTFPIVALGTFTERFEKSGFNWLRGATVRYVALANARAGKRSLSVDRYASAWGHKCRFLLVRR